MNKQILLFIVGIFYAKTNQALAFTTTNERVFASCVKSKILPLYYPHESSITASNRWNRGESFESGGRRKKYTTTVAPSKVADSSSDDDGNIENTKATTGIKNKRRFFQIIVQKLISIKGISNNEKIGFMNAIILPSIGATVMPVSNVRKLAMALAGATLAVTFVKQQNRILFPGGHARDESFTEPLPKFGKFEGCPIVGPLGTMVNFNQYLSKQASKLGSPKLWKMYMFAKPTAIISGSESIRELLENEFEKKSSSKSSADKGEHNNGFVKQVDTIGSSDLLFGTNSMLSVTKDKNRYQYLRRLVGESMTPKALNRAIQPIQELTESSVKKILENASSSKNNDIPVLSMKQVCTDLTLDVAWKQIIGLRLKNDDEINQFRVAVKDWSAAVSNYALYLLPRFAMRRTKGYRARKFLVTLIDEKINDLEKNGPDGSALSAMVFATDKDENSTEGISSSSDRKLTREEVIDNTLILILAGHETSSNTLTNAMYLLGRHRNVWDALVAEQREVVSKHGNTITKEILDHDFSYADSVVKEVMRLLPISGGGLREVGETVIVNGTQIPKNWYSVFGVALTHEQDPVTKVSDGSHMDLMKGFRPERWLQEDTRPTTEYMPFGVGNRFCLGHGLAMMEMKIFLAILARNLDSFDLLNTNPKWKEGIIITPADGVEIKVLDV